MAKKIALINNKGGSAKTTTVVNLCGAYTKRFPRQRILIVDTDGQGNATRSFALNPKDFEYTMYDVFMGNKNPEDCIVNAYGNIDIIPANTAMNYVEFDEMGKFGDKMAVKVVSSLRQLGINVADLNEDKLATLIRSQVGMTDNYFNMLAEKFDNVNDNYDLIVFDTPPELKAVTSSVLAIADEVIIPFEPDAYSMDGIMNVMARIEDIKDNKNPDLHIAGLMAVKVRSNTKIHINTINNVIKYCVRNNIHYFETEISHSIRFASSTGFSGLPATITQRSNPFVQAYYSLLDELLRIGVL